jgi:hemerythrin-like domain-containing protein
MQRLTGLQGRRKFLKHSIMLAAAAPFLVPAPSIASLPPPEGEDIPPVEELMREHGILDRLLLIYDDLGQRLVRGEELPEDTLLLTTELVRRYIQDFHEKLEEDHVFPWFDDVEGFPHLVKVLVKQHKAGRFHVDRLLRLADPQALGNPSNRRDVLKSIEAFTTMYRPHKSREDTVLFPALHEVATAYDMASLSETFLEKEVKMFGEDGFREMVIEVGLLERELNIHRLELFTPEI